MNVFILVTTCVFMHIIDDYYLQGILVSMKQKEWWQKNAPDKLYKYDYIWALIMHSFSWTSMIMIPILFYKYININNWFILLFFINITIHALTDDLKANKKIINLWQDQLIHIFQIIFTVGILLLL